MPLVEEGEKLLQNVARETGLTESGVAFLKAALDPMHDSIINGLSGWPDGETGPSIVRCVKQSLTFKTPYASGSGNWNLSVIGWPWLTATNGSIYYRTGSHHAIQPLLTALTYGGVTAYASTSSNFNWIGNVPLDGVLTPVGALSLPGTYHKGFGRLIGYGLEVVDTTAELYKQGLVTTFRVAQGSPQRETSYTIQTSVASGPVNTVRIRAPPRSVAEAMLLPGTRQWEAKFGSYAVASFTGSENEAVLPQYEDPHFAYDDATPGVSDVGAISGWTKTPDVSPTNGAYANRVPLKVEQINMSGMFFTGLNENSTLTLKWNVFYETFPGPDEPEILVLARPPADYDLLALEILKREILRMPVACYAGMNPNGEWFWEIVNDIADFAPILASVVPGMQFPVELLAKSVKAFANKKLAKDQKKTRKQAQIRAAPKPPAQQQKAKREKPKRRQAKPATAPKK